MKGRTVELIRERKISRDKHRTEIEPLKKYNFSFLLRMIFLKKNHSYKYVSHAILENKVL